MVPSRRGGLLVLRAVPREIRLDNLKTGVLRADIYDPQLNRSYAELAQQLRRAPRPLPCRQAQGQAPRRAGGALRARQLLAGRDFGSVEEMQEAARRWRRAPWRHVGKRLHVRIGERVVRIYDGNELVKTHLRRRGERRYTDPADYPPEKIAFLQRTPAWCRRRAEEVGPKVTALVAEMLGGPHPLACLRQAQGVVRLADTYDSERLNVACGRALLADGSLRTVRTILTKGLDLHDGDHADGACHVGAFPHGQQVLLAETSQ